MHGSPVDAPIDVGWGSKETQFHGSIGRAHLHHPSPPAPTHTQDDSAHADADNDLPRITWRGDGAFFAVSTRSSSPTAQRAIRVYSSTGRLQSTSEHTQGLGACIAWRPNGGLIASTRNEDRPGGKDVHDVVFFERNGLRHGEFGLRWPTAKDGSVGFVKDLLWSPDSAVLAVWVVHTKENEGDTVQLWTTGNYHWCVRQVYNFVLNGFIVAQVPEARNLYAGCRPPDERRVASGASAGVGDDDGL